MCQIKKCLCVSWPGRSAKTSTQHFILMYLTIKGLFKPHTKNQKTNVIWIFVNVSAERTQQLKNARQRPRRPHSANQRSLHGYCSARLWHSLTVSAGVVRLNSFMDDQATRLSMWVSCQHFKKGQIYIMKQQSEKNFALSMCQNPKIRFFFYCCCCQTWKTPEFCCFVAQYNN